MAHTIALLSAGLTIAISVVYTILSSLAIHYRSSCEAGITSQPAAGSSFFLNTLLKLYFKQTDCAHSIQIPDITQEQTVFIISFITLLFSLVCLLSAVAFIYVVCSKHAMKYQPVGYCYVVALIMSIVIEITIAAHFGMDYATFGEHMKNSSPGLSVNYQRDMYRLGALILMFAGLKGGVVPALNLIFVILLLRGRLQPKNQNEEHSMLQEGALQAFDHTRPMDAPSILSIHSNERQRGTQPRHNDQLMSMDSTFLVSTGNNYNAVEPSRLPSDLNEQPRHNDQLMSMDSTFFVSKGNNYNAVEPSRLPSDLNDPSSPWHHNQLTMQSRPIYLDIPRQPALVSSSPIPHQPLPVPDY